MKIERELPINAFLQKYKYIQIYALFFTISNRFNRISKLFFN